jgi:hypothetical protein
MIDHEFIVPKRPKGKPIDHNDPLSKPSIAMIIGCCGSGKSTCVANLLIAHQKSKKFDSALFVTTNLRDPLVKSLEMESTNNPSRLSEYITELKQAKEGTNHLLVLDDIQGSPAFNIFSNRSEFVNFLLSHRHFGEDPLNPDLNGTWIISTAQTLKNSFSTSMRDQISYFFLYYPNKSTKQSLINYGDLAQNPDAMYKAMALLKNRGRHNFLFLNKSDPENDQYYIGFKEKLVDL